VFQPVQPSEFSGCPENDLESPAFGQILQAGSPPPFLISDVKIDTDAALATAKGKEDAYEKKNPGKPVLFLLEKSSRFAHPAWRVIWGESVGTSGFSVYVDATTGAFLEIMH
jgi:hypothetical protein